MRARNKMALKVTERYFAHPISDGDQLLRAGPRIVSARHDERSLDEFFRSLVEENDTITSALVEPRV